MRLDHVGVMTQDIEKAIKFYEEIVGMTFKQKVYQNDGEKILAFLGFKNEPETDLELVQDSGEYPIEGKVNHIAIAIENIQEFFEHIKEKNVNFIEEKIITLPNGYQYFFISGPENEKIEFFQR
ncbi:MULTISPECIES: VOC family protein [Oceanobacillus]|uniref:VOC family protein n=1 Tax=Oceanobacillus TaxID=182709 RepID=UPI0030FC6576